MLHGVRVFGFADRSSYRVTRALTGKKKQKSILTFYETCLMCALRRTEKKKHPQDNECVRVCVGTPSKKIAAAAPLPSRAPAVRVRGVRALTANVYMRACRGADIIIVIIIIQYYYTYIYI